MQHFICTGRLCDNPSITQGQKSKRAYFQIAISRDIRKEGAPDADFLNCVAFKDRADFVEKYLRKGMKIEVMGRIETSSYEKDGNRIPTFKVIVSYLNLQNQKQQTKNIIWSRRAILVMNKPVMGMGFLILILFLYQIMKMNF